LLPFILSSYVTTTSFSLEGLRTDTEELEFQCWIKPVGLTWRHLLQTQAATLDDAMLDLKNGGQRTLRERLAGIQTLRQHFN